MRDYPTWDLPFGIEEQQKHSVLTDIPGLVILFPYRILVDNSNEVIGMRYGVEGRDVFNYFHFLSWSLMKSRRPVQQTQKLKTPRKTFNLQNSDDNLTHMLGAPTARQRIAL